MKLIGENIELLLMAAAVGQLMMACLNLFLERWLGWSEDLAKLPPLLREVFHVHSYFISFTLLIFGVITLRFAADLAAGNNELGRWLAVGIGAFWGIRVVMQWAYYGWEHWRGQPGRIAVHLILTGCYGGCTGLYFYVGLMK